LKSMHKRFAEPDGLSVGNEKAEKTIPVPKEILLNILKELVSHESLDMKILWANRVACERGGMTIDKIVGRHCYEVWAGRTEPCPDCPVENAIKTGQPHETEVVDKYGNAWLIHGYPIRDSKGNITSGMEIAKLLILSPRTIDLHRLNIRQKLGLKSKNVNLRSTLLSYS